MKLGMAEQDITPEVGIFQGGYGFRDHGAEGVRDPLAVVAAVIEQGKRRIMLCSFDLVYVDESLIRSARKSLSKMFGIAPGDMIFHATHTHSAPEPRQDSDKWNEKNTAYAKALLPALETAVGKAVAGMKACTVSYIQDTADFNVYRRRFKNGQMTMSPNYEVPVDKRVRGLVFTAKNGKRLGVIYTYNCHMNVCGDYEISADFAGWARAAIRRDLKCPSLYLQGCCGDVRPRMVNDDGTGFRRGTTEDVRDCGEQLAAALVRGLKIKTKVIPALGCAGTRIILPLKPAPTVTRLRAIIKSGSSEKKWADILLKHLRGGKKPITKQPYDMQALALGKGLVLLFLRGEVVSEYATLLEKCYPDLNLWCHGYSHADLNYIPTSHILAEGGYEASSYMYTKKPVSGPYGAGLEKDIFAAAGKLIKAIHKQCS
ncbi:MAG: neutral/alkaline non-lysosomal ceramidase N-terminal domain-containing protein [Planctomycetota bacterium]